MILYHVTSERNIESILAFGLIPAYKRGLTCGEPRDVVWLTTDPKYIMTRQAGETWCNNHSAVILRIRCDRLDIKHFTSFDVDSCEYYTEDMIEPYLILGMK